MPFRKKRLLVLAVTGALVAAGGVAWADTSTDAPRATSTAGLGRAADAAVDQAGAVGVNAAAPRIWNVDTSVVYQWAVSLTAGASVTVTTTELTAGADPILHLLDANGVEVARDDNGGGGTAARISYRPTTTGAHHIILRARTASTGGTTFLKLNDGAAITGRRVTFAAWNTISLAGLRAGERIGSVRMPNATVSGHALFLLTADGAGIADRQAGGNDGAADLVLPSALGTRSVVLAASSGTATERARLVRNDVGVSGHDTDDDGLGSELEAAAGTCATAAVDVAGVDCGALTDLRDTDGDGLSDHLELVGARRLDGNGNIEDLPLPKWGANPRHKDLFVEVDFMRRTEQENDDQTRLMMATTVARNFSKFYGDDMTTDAASRTVHASQVGNPDGQPGIAVHLDTGRAPETAADATKYGDWGGYTAVDAIQVGGEYRGVEAEAAWRTKMSQARRGIFRYALAYGTGGGQAGEGFAASYNFNSSFVAPHETGHTFGLVHSGPGGTQPDVNCKPNYPSLMNYAFDSGEAGFADGRAVEGPPLNNWSLRESGVAAGKSAAFFDRMENVFGYYVDRANGHVDWNRDGDFAPASTTVRAYANLSLGGGGCEYVRYNRTRVSNALSMQPPALARRDDKLFTFYAYDNEVRSTTSTSSWNCPVPVGTGCAGGSWTSGASLGLPTSAGSVDAVTIGSGISKQILVVAVDLNNDIWERYLGAASSTVWRKLSGKAAVGGPSLLRAGDGSVYLAYTDPASGGYRMRHRSTGGVWGAEETFRTSTGTPLGRPAGSNFSPELVEATLPWQPSAPRVYAMLAGADDKLDLYGFAPATRRWSNTSLLDTRPGPVNWRPALEWVPPGPTSNAGRLHLLYSNRSDAVAKMMMSYVRVTRSATGAVTKEHRVGLHTYFDNVWRTIGGADLLFEPGVDTNLRAAMGFASNKELWFNPKADGIHNSTYHNFDEWSFLRYKLCSGVVDPGDLVTNPIRCAAAP